MDAAAVVVLAGVAGSVVFGISEAISLIRRRRALRWTPAQQRLAALLEDRWWEDPD